MEHNLTLDIMEHNSTLDIMEHNLTLDIMEHNLTLEHGLTFDTMGYSFKELFICYTNVKLKIIVGSVQLLVINQNILWVLIFCLPKVVSNQKQIITNYTSHSVKITYH